MIDRDVLAMETMKVLLQRGFVGNDTSCCLPYDEDMPDTLAEDAYRIADAMLKEGAKGLKEESKPVPQSIPVQKDLRKALKELIEQWKDNSRTSFDPKNPTWFWSVAWQLENVLQKYPEDWQSVPAQQFMTYLDPDIYNLLKCLKLYWKSPKKNSLGDVALWCDLERAVAKAIDKIP